MQEGGEGSGERRQPLLQHLAGSVAAAARMEAGVRRLPQGQPERRRQAVGLAVAAALLPRYSTSVASRPQTAAKLIQ